VQGRTVVVVKQMDVVVGQGDNEWQGLVVALT